jgi:hypothetical protein
MEVGMRESSVELSVGDSVQFDDQILTVIDIHGDEVTFRVDHCDEQPAVSQFQSGDEFVSRPPR